MGRKNLHGSPFEESTIAKLEIFEDYAQAWIPTWVMQKATREIHIFDFFAGPGYDENKTPGSPIRILKKIKEQKDNVLQKNVKIVVHLNEFDRQKSDQLKTSCDEFMASDTIFSTSVKVEYYQEDFEKLFDTLLPKIKRYPSLVYLDQNGVKFLSETYLLALEKTSQTDFLAFLSSSHISRFGNKKEFKKYLNIDMKEVKKQSTKQIHRVITQQFQKRLPPNTKLKLYPFSLKKGKNIYGIIFGATHPKAVDGFLNIGWKRNGENGDANFDINDEAGKDQLDIFGGRKLTKIKDFQQRVHDKVLNGTIENNFQMLDFVYEQGHIGKHAANRLKEMRKRKKIDFKGSSPLVSYNSVHKNKKKVEYKVLNK